MEFEDIQRNVQSCLSKMPQRGNVRRLSLFGSYLHGNTHKESDIDLLLELKEPIGYFDLVRIQEALEGSLGRSVDLVTPKALSKHFRNDVMREAKQIYEG